MLRTRNPYPTAFREQMVALVRTRRSVESLSREYEPCAATIHDWVRQTAADDGDDPSSLTSEERDELRQLRREVKQLRQERDILSKAAAWFAQNDVISRRSSSS
ncbi:MAG: transposase [Pseudomonadota bacterium]